MEYRHPGAGRSRKIRAQYFGCPLLNCSILAFRGSQPIRKRLLMTSRLRGSAYEAPIPKRRLLVARALRRRAQRKPQQDKPVFPIL